MQKRQKEQKDRQKKN